MKTKPLTSKHFAKLADYGLQGLPQNCCRCLCFQAGETIFQEGMPLTWLAVIVRGKAKICSTTPSGKHLILCYYLSDGMVGDIELMTGIQTASASMIAITDFECIAVFYQGHEVALKCNTVFLNKLGNELAKKLMRSSDSFVAAALHSGEERLCSYILQTSHNGIFSDILTDVSSSVGMSYRHMLRLLKELCRAGVLERRESGYRITAPDELTRRAYTGRCREEFGSKMQ